MKKHCHVHFFSVVGRLVGRSEVSSRDQLVSYKKSLPQIACDGSKISGSVNVSVNTKNGGGRSQLIQIDVEYNDTVEDVKAKIQHKTGYSGNSQHLFSRYGLYGRGGTELKVPGKFLFAYNIAPGSTLGLRKLKI